MTMIEMETGEYLNTLCPLLEQGKLVDVPVAGNSMYPFLEHGRDTVYLERPEAPLRRGDVVLFRRRSGQFVLHRIVRCENGSFWITGDAQQNPEGPIAQEQIAGIVTCVMRDGKQLKPGDRRWEFYARTWVRLVPVRHIVLRLLRIRKKERKKSSE